MSERGSLKGLTVTMKKHPSSFKLSGQLEEINKNVKGTYCLIFFLFKSVPSSSNTLRNKKQILYINLYLIVKQFFDVKGCKKMLTFIKTTFTLLIFTLFSMFLKSYCPGSKKSFEMTLISDSPFKNDTV